MRELLFEKKLSLAEKAFFLILNDLKGESNVFCIGREELSERTGVSLVAIKKYIDNLVEHGYIEYHRMYMGKGRPMSSEYTIIYKLED